MCAFHPRITEKDWSFQKIREGEPCRAARLESCRPPNELINALVQSIITIKNDDLRIGVDSKGCRAIVQFRVTPTLYDWFYNGRTGYRAQFWISPDTGMKFNNRSLTAVVKALTERLAEAIPVRRISVRDDGASCDVGEIIAYPREELLRSLTPKISKIWIGEQLIQTSMGPMKDVLTLLHKAEKLCVRGWPVEGEGCEGLRALLPCPEYCWLDVKGGFLSAKGEPDQIKSPRGRAQQIHKCGWTWPE